jgi:hypothetical protein
VRLVSPAEGLEIGWVFAGARCGDEKLVFDGRAT